MLKQGLREKPEERIHIFYILASHGMMKSGRQVVLINEFNKRISFYKLWQIEFNIRDIADLFPNSY